MSGNICRCGAYPGIVAAIKEVQSGRRTALTWEFASDEQIKVAMNNGINEGSNQEVRTDEII